MNKSTVFQEIRAETKDSCTLFRHAEAWEVRLPSCSCLARSGGP
jgi:hypothetical protein